jgi:diguanylate cyclase (GGDEF)-like protein
MAIALEKKLGFYINVAALVSLIASVLTIFFFVGALNRNAVKTDTQLLTAGVASAASQNEIWTVDYGWSADLLELFHRGNTYWLGESLASTFSDHTGFDFTVLSEETTGRIYGWHRDEGLKPRTNLVSPEDFAELRRDLALSYEFGEYTSSHLMVLDGRSYIASVTVLGEYADRSLTDPAVDPIMIIGTEIGAGFLNNLETNYLIENVQFLSHAEAPIAGAVPVNDLNGHEVGQLIWEPSEPGLHALRLALIPLLIYIIGFAGASQIIGQHVRQLARQVEKSRTRANQAASTDSMSALPNRRGFMEFVQSQSVEAAAAAGQAAVIYIDLNGFKAINDKAGHQAGDAVIKIVAKRLSTVAGPKVHIARMGGDEFACALAGTEQTANTVSLARRLGHSLSLPVEIDGQIYEIGAAIGLATSSVETTKSFSELVRDADLAMYRAKAAQLDHPLSYDVSFQLEDTRRRELEADMERGLTNGEFYVLYQPIVDSESNAIISVEALSRWEHPELGAVPPDVFIPVAENSRLIEKLGDLVIDAICRDFGPNAPHTISVNVSPVQLDDPELVGRMVKKLRANRMTPSQIEIELTESVLIQDFEKAKTRLEELNQAGFRINLDDFGTGFASMGYLQSLPFSKIKIDKSFVGVIGKDDGHNKLLQALSLLGDALDLAVVAEGVETETQAKLLRLLGFEYLQGWHFGRPMPASGIHERTGQTTSPIALQTINARPA